MKTLSVKNIRFFSIAYFAIAGLVFLTMIYSGQRSAIMVGGVLFVVSILPILLPFRAFRLIYAMFAFMASFFMLTAFIFQSFAWMQMQGEILSFVIILSVLAGYVCASAGLAYSSVKSLDPKRFTLI